MVPSLRFPHQDPIHPPLLTHTCHMPSPSHSSRFYHPHNIVYAGIKGKLRCTLVQALRLRTGCKAHRGSRGLALLFLDLSIRRGEGSASRSGRSLPLRKTRYPLYRRLGGSQGRSGQVQKISLPPGFDPRTVQPVASRYTDYATQPIWYGGCRVI